MASLGTLRGLPADSLSKVLRCTTAPQQLQLRTLCRAADRATREATVSTYLHQLSDVWAPDGREDHRGVHEEDEAIEVAPTIYADGIPVLLPFVAYSTRTFPTFDRLDCWLDVVCSCDDPPTWLMTWLDHAIGNDRDIAVVPQCRIAATIAAWVAKLQRAHARGSSRLVARAAGRDDAGGGASVGPHDPSCIVLSKLARLARPRIAPSLATGLPPEDTGLADDDVGEWPETDAERAVLHFFERRGAFTIARARPRAGGFSATDLAGMRLTRFHRDTPAVALQLLACHTGAGILEDEPLLPRPPRSDVTGPAVLGPDDLLAWTPSTVLPACVFLRGPIRWNRLEHTVAKPPSWVAFGEGQVSFVGAHTALNNVPWRHIDLTHVGMPPGHTHGNVCTSCPNLRVLLLPRWAPHIGQTTGHACPQLRTLVFGPHIVSAGPNALDGCALLRGMDVPACLGTLPRGMLDGAGQIEVLDLSGTSVVTIEGASCCRLARLHRLSFPASLDSIGDGAFSHCPELRCVNFFGSANAPRMHDAVHCHLRSVGMRVFECCPALRSLAFPPEVQVFGTFGAGCTSLTLLDLSRCGKLSAVPVQRFAKDLAERLTVVLHPAASGLRKLFGAATVHVRSNSPDTESAAELF